jgi:acetyl esterase/lipase
MHDMKRISGKRALRGLAMLSLLAMAPDGALLAQNGPPSGMPRTEPIAAPKEPASIPLYAGVAPGSEGAQQQEQWVGIGNDRLVRNVTKPTLTPFLPAPGKATGAAVIVAPGGGFYVLAMDNEGYPVAKYLADHGIAAFLLKYRVDPTPADHKGFEAHMAARMGAAMKADAKTPPPKTPAAAAMDGAAALRLVRSRASEWNVDSKRVGMIGFSAGAMLTLTMALADNASERPAFVGLIYGPMNRVAVPDDAPPAFIALAANDPLFARGSFELVDAWRAAKRPVEFHLYQDGDHGFGMRLQSGTYAMWKEEFVDWIKWNGWLAAAGCPSSETKSAEAKAASKSPASAAHASATSCTRDP